MTQDTMARLIKMADAHAAADLYRKGRYETCSVGCTIQSAVEIGMMPPTANDNHAALAVALGTTDTVVRLQDSIYEGLPDEDARTWTPRLLRSIASSGGAAQLDARIAARLARRLESDAIRDDVRAVASLVAAMYERRAAGDEPSDPEWKAAWHQAAAAWQQADAAWHQAAAAWRQTDAAWRQWWSWCADTLIEEVVR